MAIDSNKWNEARKMFEAGMSLSAISNETNISKSQISKTSRIENWKKGTSEYFIKDIKIVPINGIVYIIQAGDTKYYKIGITSGSIGKRLDSLQTGNHLKLNIIHTYYSNNINKLEKELHERYSDKRSIGEWFILEDTILKNLIKELSNG
jgi:hypothetical protein